MRHELMHGFHANNKGQANSLQSLIKNWGAFDQPGSTGPWRQAASRLLAEVNSNAAQAKSVPGQIGSALKFLASPDSRKYYTQSPGYGANPMYGAQYRMLHNTAHGLVRNAPPAAIAAAGNAAYSTAAPYFQQPADSVNTGQYAEMGVPPTGSGYANLSPAALGAHYVAPHLPVPGAVLISPALTAANFAQNASKLRSK
jgi:hypothetical protein